MRDFDNNLTYKFENLIYIKEKQEQGIEDLLQLTRLCSCCCVKSLGRSIDGGKTFLVLVLLSGDSLLSFQESFSVLIKLELNNSTVGGMDWDLGLAAYVNFRNGIKAYRWSSPW